MTDDLKSCSVCGNRLASKWSKGDLVHYCSYCAVAECSDDAPALRETEALRARAEAAEQRAEAAEAAVARMFASARATADRYTRDAENARKHRLVWEESAGMAAEVAKLMLRALEKAAQPAGEVS